MSVLPLRSDCLLEPNRFDVAVLEFAMLWPDDPDMQQAAINAVLLEEGRSFVDDMPIEMSRDYSRLALDSERLVNIRASTGDRHRNGMIAGSIMLQAIILNNAGRATSITALREKLAEDLRARSIQIRPQTMANTDGPVAKFRSVSHFWAAHVWHRLEGRRSFPCCHADLEAFLSVAEAIRELAENTTTPHSKSPVLVRGEVVELPQSVKPTKVLFDFGAKGISSDTEIAAAIR